MIAKSRGYSMLFYAVLLLAFFFLAFLVSVAAGGGVPKTWWGFAVLASLAFASTFFARAVVDRAFLRHLEALAREYDEGCLPGRFLEGVRGVKRRNGEVRGVWGVWLFSRWGMALDDGRPSPPPSMRRAPSGTPPKGPPRRSPPTLRSRRFSALSGRSSFWTGLGAKAGFGRGAPSPGRGWPRSRGTGP